MRGLMMQALPVHRETREFPAYALTFAKGGPKLKPFQEGNCTTLSLTHPAPAPSERMCQETERLTLDDYCTWLCALTDRPVINRTGLAGKFDLRSLVCTPDDSTPGMLGCMQIARERLGHAPNESSEPSGAPSIFTALQQQFGWKLEPTKGPRDFIVIDHIQSPTAN
jgi:uncharacterized protein (TIGR03435 family)